MPARRVPDLATVGDGPSHLTDMAPKVTAAQVLDALRRHYGLHRDGRLTAPEWAALAEFSVDLGVERPRCDLFVVRAWSGRPKGHERHAIEIKVSRTDLRNELVDPAKRQAFAQQWPACGEYRFCGALGVGGKVWAGHHGDPPYVTQYPEDATDASRTIIERANRQLAEIVAAP